MSDSPDAAVFRTVKRRFYGAGTTPPSPYLPVHLSLEGKGSGLRLGRECDGGSWREYVKSARAREECASLPLPGVAPCFAAAHTLLRTAGSSDPAHELNLSGRRVVLIRSPRRASPQAARSGPLTLDRPPDRSAGKCFALGGIVAMSECCAVSDRSRRL